MAVVTGRYLFSVWRGHVPPALGVLYISKCHASSDANIATYKKGRGGRSSFSGMVTTVFGATGFMGKYVVNKLGKIGSQIIIPHRCDPYFVRPLRLAGDLGQVLFVPFHLEDEDSLRKVMKYSNVVVNLIGRDYETKNFKFDDVNYKGAQRIARIARESGVEKFLHFSHLNASPNPMPIYVKGGNKYLKTKYYGETAVREEFPNAIIFRPSDIFGSDDRFFNYYATRWRRALGRLPLWKRGEETIKIPVYCRDVAEGVINALQNPDAVGKTYECIGPNSYMLSELTEYFYRCMRFEHFMRVRVTPFFKLKVRLLELTPWAPILSMDRLDRDFISDQPEGLDTLTDLEVQLNRVEDRARPIFKYYRYRNYYEEKVGEFPDPKPPRPIVV